MSRSLLSPGCAGRLCSEHATCATETPCPWRGTRTQQARVCACARVPTLEGRCRRPQVRTHARWRALVPTVSLDPARPLATPPLPHALQCRCPEWLSQGDPVPLPPPVWPGCPGLGVSWEKRVSQASCLQPGAGALLVPGPLGTRLCSSLPSLGRLVMPTHTR